MTGSDSGTRETAGAVRPPLEGRKREEQSFHDRLRGLGESDPEYASSTSNEKFYAVARASTAFMREWLIRRCAGKRVLDYGCGDGTYSFLCAAHGARAVGVDISEVSVRKAREEAARRGVAERTQFLVMDGEAMGFGSNAFDVACVSGVLHHLDLSKALAELARVLKPDGEVICAEPLAHNPVFQLYRRLTPQLRTRWEVDHLIRRRDVRLAREYFHRVETRFFHLSTLVAVPIRRLAVFERALGVAEVVDRVLLRLPVLRWLAWQVVFTLAGPRKSAAMSPLADGTGRGKMYPAVKRIFDVIVAMVGLLVLWPVMLLIAAAIRADSPGPMFYRGVRVGRFGRPFRIYKFRTLVVDAEKMGGPSTADDDPRITRIGRVLRRYKLDELPQLVNVLKGEMSIVGPRPEVQQYVELFTEEERAILAVQPGMTDWASIWNPDEGALLAGSEDPERTYLEKVRPTKIRLQLEYVRRRSFWVDLVIVAQTVAALLATAWTRRRPTGAGRMRL